MCRLSRLVMLPELRGELKMEFNISVNELKGFEIIAKSADAPRYYLRGIFVEYLPETQKLALVATDGHRMLFKVFDPSHSNIVPDDFANFENFIIPVETIKQAIAGMRGTDSVTISVDVNSDNVIEHHMQNVHFRPIDGKYPDWKRVIPSGVDNEIGQYDPKYIGEFGRIAKLIGKKSGKIHVRHNGQQAAHIDFGIPDYYGVLMPVRTKPLDQSVYLQTISDNLNMRWSVDSPLKVVSINA